MTAAAPPRALARYREEFPVFRHAVYLNSCSLGPLSVRGRRAVERFLDQWEARGAQAWYDTWLPAQERLRAGYAAILGARAAELSLHPCVSSALAVVAASLDYRSRPRVVTTTLDFPTVPYQWLAREAEGVEVVLVESPDGVTVPAERLIAAMDERTALVATSHVYFTTGAIQDLAAVTAAAHRHGALVLADGYHAAGQIPVDVAALGVDFYCGGGLKWLLGGPGIAYLYARGDLVPRLEPRMAGWFGDAEQFRFDPTRLARAPDARRLDQGTPSVASIYAQLAGLELLEEAGLAAVHRATAELREDLVAAARERGLQPRVPERAAERSAIVTLPRTDPAADVRRLAEAGYVVDARPGLLRISPYFYNRPEDHRGLLEALTRE